MEDLDEQFTELLIKIFLEVACATPWTLSPPTAVNRKMLKEMSERFTFAVLYSTHLYLHYGGSNNQRAFSTPEKALPETAIVPEDQSYNDVQESRSTKP